MRRFGLILVNADGFDPPRGFVLRSTQNMQALANSTTPQDPSFGIDFSTNGRNPNPPERLGWGNDGRHSATSHSSRSPSTPARR